MVNKNKSSKGQDVARKSHIKEIFLLIFAAILGAFSTYVFDTIKENEKEEKSALLLYYDLKKARDGINILSNDIEKIEDKKQTTVFTSIPHATYINKYGELLIDVRDELNKKDLENIITYYDNLRTLEQLRKSFIEIQQSRNTEKIASAYNQYTDFMDSLNNTCEEHQPCIEDSISKLENLDSLK